MKEVKITNGVVILKDFCSRKLKKEISNALMGEADLKTVDGKQEIAGISFKSIEKANDISLVGMVEKIIINGEEIKPTLSYFDEMDNKDVNIIIEEINKIVSPKEDTGE